MTGEQVIKDIKQAFGVYGLGDINHNIDRPLSCFILCFCFLDQLAAYRFNSNRSHSRFNTIIEKYLPHYNSFRLYETLRNKLLHSYSTKDAYMLFSDKSFIEENEFRNMDLLNTYVFVPEIENVYKKIETEFDKPNSEAKNCAIKFVLENKIHVITSKNFDFMNYTSEQAEVLIKHYTPLMKDKYLDEAKELKIVAIIKESQDGINYIVKVLPNRMQQVVQFWREIWKAAEFLNLESPEQVLKGHNLLP